MPGVRGVQENRASLRTGLGMQVGVAWHRLLTGRLDDQTKLAGPVISCEGTPFEGNAGGQWRFNPHVQSYTLAMDAVSPHAPQFCLHISAAWVNRLCGSAQMPLRQLDLDAPEIRLGAPPSLAHL